MTRNIEIIGDIDVSEHNQHNATLRVAVLGPRQEGIRDHKDSESILQVYCTDDDNEMGEEVKIPLDPLINLLVEAGVVKA